MSEPMSEQRLAEIRSYKLPVIGPTARDPIAAALDLARRELLAELDRQRQITELVEASAEGIINDLRAEVRALKAQNAEMASHFRD